MSSKIKICSKCGKIGLEIYDFGLIWQGSVNKYYYRGRCKKCLARHKREFRAENPEYRERQLKCNRRNWAKHPEYLEKHKQYYYENRDRLIAQKKKYYLCNRETVLAQKKVYSKNHKVEISVRANKRRAMKLNQTPTLTENEKKKIELYYRISQYLGEDWHVDHITPISKGGLHHPNNLQITTKKYNLAKHNRTDFREPKPLEYFRI